MSNRQARLIGCAVIFVGGVLLCQNPQAAYGLPGTVAAWAGAVAFAVDWALSWRESR